MASVTFEKSSFARSGKNSSVFSDNRWAELSLACTELGWTGLCDWVPITLSPHTQAFYQTLFSSSEPSKHSTICLRELRGFRLPSHQLPHLVSLFPKTRKLTPSHAWMENRACRNLPPHRQETWKESGFTTIENYTIKPLVFIVSR